MPTLEPRLPGSRSSRTGLRLLALFALLAAGCSARRRAEPSAPPQRSSRVEVYLQASAPGDPPLLLRLSGMRVRAGDGTEVELELHRDTIRSDRALSRVALGGGAPPPGSYEALVLLVDGLAEVGPGRPRSLRLLAPGESELPEAPLVEGEREVLVPTPIAIGHRSATVVFLRWDVAATRLGGLNAWPALSSSFEFARTRLGSLYVADAASGIVMAVDPRTGEVVGTGKVGEKPLALALTPDRRQLLVANAGAGSLTVLDARRHEFETSIPIRLGADPRDVVVLDGDGLAATANRGLDSVSLFDISSLTRVADLSVGRAPVRLAAVPARRRLFVVASLSDELTVIDTATRATLAGIRTESRPSAVTANRRGDEVYVGHFDSPHLLVVNAERLSVTDTIYVGAGVTAVHADRRRDRIYVARERPSELAIVDRRLARVVRRVRLSAPVVNLAQPLEGSLLYGASPVAGKLVVVDVLAQREVESLETGGRPVDVVSVD